MLFEITDSDTSLGEEIALKCGDIPAPQWARLVAQLRAGGYIVRPKSESGDLVRTYARVDKIARDILTNRAPVGTVPTAELITSIKAEIVAAVSDELRSSGLPEGTAKALSALLTVALLVKPKAETDDA